ncbi:uncharacterized protein LOC134830427 [Culicoides brevitarsis]|uniref:uncharacterized protein LOC134830427 n=1 Tax=Culicoides brevitarsis TaxID=469753 RepID=UPI00307BE097
MLSRYTLHDTSYAESVRRELICDLLKIIHADTLETDYPDFLTWCKNAESVKMKIDKQFSTPKSGCTKYFVKTASLYVLRSEQGQLSELSQKAVEMLEPNRLEPDVICVFALTLHLTGCICFASGVYDQAIHFNCLSERVIDEFKATRQSLPEDLSKCLFKIYDLVLSKLYDCYGAVKNTAMQVKYAVLLIERIIFNQSTTTDDKISIHVLTMIQTYVETIIEHRHFAQINYLLSLLMKELENRKPPNGISPSERGFYMDMQACNDLMAFFFVRWAIAIIEYSLKVKTNKNYAEKYPLYDEIWTMKELIDEENFKYDKEFPVHVIQSRDDFTNNLKRCKEWTQKVNKWQKVEFLNKLAKLENQVDSSFSKTGWKKFYPDTIFKKIVLCVLVLATILGFMLYFMLDDPPRKPYNVTYEYMTRTEKYHGYAAYSIPYTKKCLFYDGYYRD